VSLTLTGLTRSFGALAAVNGVNLAIEPRQFVVVIGPSGAGKSTLLRLMNRLIEPTAGRIDADGVDVTALRGVALRRWRSEAAMIFQHFNLSPRLDVLTNVLVGKLIDTPWYRSVCRAFTREEKLEALGVLDELGLADKAFERAERLSGGQQQRVAIARALLQKPRFILADEPVASLDPRNAEIVMDTLRAVNRQHGITIVCNLHNVDLARSYADRVVALRDGRVVFDGLPDGLNDGRARSIYDGDAEWQDEPAVRLAVGVS
jgi:phosphonate transport system ATP-binding protein